MLPMKLLVRITISALLGSIFAICVPCGDCATPSMSSTSTTSTAGVAVVSGQLVVAGTNTLFQPRGFTSVGVVYPTQYASILCTQPNVAPGSKNAKWLEAAQAALTAPPLPGHPYNASFKAMIDDWHVNSVRIHVSPGALQYEYAHGLSAYTDMARKVIAQARAAGLIVLIDMQAETFGCTPYVNGVNKKLSDIQTEHAWKKILDTTLTNDKGVMLGVFNEPSTQKARNAGSFRHPDWKAWATGCGIAPEQGMVTVAKYLRTIAADNLLEIQGDEGGSTLTALEIPTDMPVNVVYSIHPFHYVIKSNELLSIDMWNQQFGHFEASGHAVMVTAWDEAFKCSNHDPEQTITKYFLENYLPGHSIGMIAYAWDAPNWSAGYLINSYDYP